MKKFNEIYIVKNIRSLIGDDTVTGFARKCGITNATSLANNLNGRSNPSLSTLIKIANKTGTSIDWICSNNSC